MDLIFALAVRPPGPPLQQGPPPDGVQMIGSPHGLILLVCLLLYFYVRSTYRGTQRDRQRWLEWALIGAVLTEAVSIGLRLWTPGASGGVPGWNAPWLETWIRGLSAVALVAGFLRYLLDRVQPAKTYALASTGVVTLFAFATAAFRLAHPGIGPPGSPHPHPPPFSPWLFMWAAGFGVLAVGCILVHRHVQGGGRRLMLAATAALAAGQLSSVIGSLGPFMPSPRPAYPFVMAWSALGLLLMTYLFLRVRAAEVHNDMELLEGRVQARTQELESALEELAGANALLEQQSNIDALTGAGNRRRFDDALASEWIRARRTGKPLSIAMVDLDRFKEINDVHGHPAGDQCLARLAVTLQTAARRPADLVARLGGDEFAVLLPETAGEAAAQLLDEVRTQASLLATPLADGTPMTISVGVASCVPSADDSSAELIRHADEALYRAKRSGRNRVALSESGALQVL